MASIFEELGILDLPFLPVTIPVKDKTVALMARALSAEEEDELDAIQMDEYGRLITEMTKPKPDGSMSELDRIALVYGTKPDHEIAEQLVGTREPDVRKRALEISQIDFQEELAKMALMEVEADRDAYAKEQNAAYEAAIKEAKSELQDEIAGQGHENLVAQIAQININIKALTLARKAYNSEYLFRTLYRTDEKTRAFDTADQLRQQWSSEKIGEVVTLVQEAVRTDLPFVSPPAVEPSGQPSSSSISEEATPTGGPPTETTPVA